jgi:hypothetical protein
MRCCGFIHFWLKQHIANGLWDVDHEEEFIIGTDKLINHLSCITSAADAAVFYTIQQEPISADYIYRYDI